MGTATPEPDQPDLDIKQLEKGLRFGRPRVNGEATTFAIGIDILDIDTNNSRVLFAESLQAMVDAAMDLASPYMKANVTIEIEDVENSRDN